MHELDISIGKSRSEKNWKTEYWSWEEFTERLKKVRKTKETLAQYDKMDKASKGRVKDGPAFVGGLVRGGRRKKQNMDGRSLITLDADFANEDFFFDIDLAIGGCAYAIYSTHSHRPNKPKYRLVVPIDRTVLPDEYAAISRKIADEIGLDYFDKTTFDIHRLMYFPSCSADAEPVLEVAEGYFLCADEVLAKYEDWADVLSWPRHPEASVNPHTSKVQDPHEKWGAIGLFCRAYAIEEGIETFLSEQYEEGSMAHRYTYTKGTSANGLEVYPDQDLAFSHQDSDPISDGRTYNLFDLVRIHKFGHLDENLSEESTATRPSVTAMERWVMNLPEVKKLAAAERESEYAEMLDDSDLEDPDWEAKLELHPKSGKPLSLPFNIELILSQGEFRNVLAYDAFGNTEVLREKLPWRNRERKKEPYEPWLSADDNRLRHWLGKRYEIKGQGIIMDAFKEVTQANTFHPIKEFLEYTQWDGVPRLDTLFIDYLGAEDTHYVRQVTRKMLIAAVARIYVPGCKFDEMLVLIGPQGIGKSTLLARLGGKWFSDSLRTFETKEAGEHLQVGWIFEIGELSAMKRSQVEEVKAFLSKTEDRYRVAYDRVVSDFPRKCVFFGTTNTREFLQDKTGNRRFWPVQLDPEMRTKSIWEELTEEEIHQVWAEALHRFKAGETLTLDKEAREEAEQRQGSHMEENPKIGIIQDWLESPIEDFGLGDGESQYRNRVCTAQIWIECLQNRKGAMRPWEAKELMEIMRSMPGWVEKDGKGKMKDYGVQRVFDRVSMKVAIEEL